MALTGPVIVGYHGCRVHNVQTDVVMAPRWCCTRSPRRSVWIVCCKVLIVRLNQYATHDTRLTHGHRKFRLSLSLKCHRVSKSDIKHKMSKSCIRRYFLWDHASNMQYKSGLVNDNLSCLFTVKVALTFQVINLELAGSKQFVLICTKWNINFSFSESNECKSFCQSWILIVNSDLERSVAFSSVGLK